MQFLVIKMPKKRILTIFWPTTRTVSRFPLLMHYLHLFVIRKHLILTYLCSCFIQRTKFNDIMQTTADHIDFFIFLWYSFWQTYAAITLNSFDDQEWTLTFVKKDFQVIKLKFHAWNFKQAFYPVYKLYIAWPLQHKNTFIQASFCSVPCCQTCMCKRGISSRLFVDNCIV